MNEVDLKAFPLLAELRDEDREVLVDLLDERRVAQEVPLFREGSESEGLVLLVEGEVEIASRRTGESERLGPGAQIGLWSLVAVGPREVSAVAKTPVRLLLLPRTSCHRLIEDSPRTACRLFETLCGELAGVLREGLDEVVGKR